MKKIPISILLIVVAIFTMCSSAPESNYSGLKKEKANTIANQSNLNFDSFAKKFRLANSFDLITYDSIIKLESDRVEKSILTEEEIINYLCDVKNSDCLRGNGCKSIVYVPLYTVNSDRYDLFIYSKRYDAITRHYYLMSRNKSTNVLSKILLCTRLPSVQFSYSKEDNIITINQNELCNRIMITKEDSILTIYTTEQYQIGNDGSISLVDSKKIEKFTKN